LYTGVRTEKIPSSKTLITIIKKK